MKSKRPDHKMKSFETAVMVIPADMYIVARLNARGIAQRSIESMIETTEHLMTCGFNVTYAHILDNEISLLFDLNERSYERKASKFISILAGEASAKLTQFTGDITIFESRVLGIPNKDLVVDYFKSRSLAGNNSSWIYWKRMSGERRELVTIRSGEIIEAML